MISNGLYAIGKVWRGANKLISDLYEEKLLFTFNTKPIFLRLAYLSTPVNSFRFKQVANYILGFFSIYHMLPSLHNFRKRSTLSVKYFQGVPFLLMYQPLSCNSIGTIRKLLMILRRQLRQQRQLHFESIYLGHYLHLKFN